MDLATRDAELFKHHQELAHQLLELVPAAIRDRSYAASREAIIDVLNALAEVAAELAPIRLQLREQAAARMAEHRAVVARQTVERLQQRQAEYEAVQARRDQEWGDRNVGLTRGVL